MSRTRILALCTLILFCVTLSGSAFASNGILKEFEDAFIRLGDEVRPCVVNIETRGSASEGPDLEQLPEIFKFFQIEPPPHQFRAATGSGFIYDKVGHIITNNHVVRDAEEITVKLWDGSEYPAEVVGTDPDTDLAVIKIDAKGRDLPVIELGDSDALKVGQFAIALGSPRGFEGSLSFGHVSALGREGLALEGLRFQGFIQTDAAINLGNSGGPLCDIDGKVIGINTAIVMGAQSLGFAIPINRAKEIVPILIDKGKVVRGYLGVSILDIDDMAKQSNLSSAQEFADAFGLPDTKGAYVQEVRPDTPAEKAGLKVEDVIRSINGEPIDGKSDLVQTVAAYAPGDVVKVDVWRNGKIVTLKATLEEFPTDSAELKFGKSSLGMRVENITPEMQRQLGLEDDVKGVVVMDIEKDSPAARANIAPGDVITMVGREAVENVQDFRDLISKHAEPGSTVLVRVIQPRTGTATLKVLKIPATEED